MNLPTIRTYDAGTVETFIDGHAVQPDLGALGEDCACWSTRPDLLIGPDGALEPAVSEG